MRKYLLRIAETPLKKIASQGDVVEGVAAIAVASPKTGTLLSSIPNASSAVKTKTNKDNDEIPKELLPKDELSALAFNDLQIQADITFSRKDTDNLSTPCTIVIYNLSEESIKKIKPEATIILNAGYSEDAELPMVFAGQIVRVIPSQEGVNHKLKLLCDGVYTIRKNVRFSKHYSKGNSYLDIIKDLASEIAKMGIPTGAIRTNSRHKSKTKPSHVADKSELKPAGGYSVKGYILDELAEVCKIIDYKCYVQNGSLYVEPKGFATGLESVQVQQDDIIGTVDYSEDATKGKTGEITYTATYTLTVLLSGIIDLNKVIHIVEGPYKGYYDIEEMNIKLDYEGNDWFMILQMSKVMNG